MKRTPCLEAGLSEHAGVADYLPEEVETVKHLSLLTAFALMASPAFGALSSWADPWGRSMTPTSTWAASSTQGVFGGVGFRAGEKETMGGGETNPETAPVSSPAMPATSLSITAQGLLDFVLGQLYASFTGEEAARIRAVLAPQYEAMAAHLQSAFGGAETVAFPEAPAPTPDAGASGKGTSPEAAAKVVTVTHPAPAPLAGDVLTTTQTMAVVAATSLLVSPAPTLGGESSNLGLLGELPVGGFSATVLDTSVPEPGTVILMAVGLVALAARRRSI